MASGEAGDEAGAAARAGNGGAGPLAGIRVVDLGVARAGPVCARQLSEMGADVVQVWAPHRGDTAGSDGQNLHRGKRSVLLDLTVPAGRDAFLRLVRRADVLVENHRPDVKHRLGIGPDALLAENPRLVYASCSGFGQRGPYADRPGVDQIAQGLGGLMSVTGPPGTGPWRAGIAISDVAAGTFLTQAVLAALVARERTGRGQWVQTSLLETMVNLMDFQAVRYLNEGVVPGQAGNDHPTFFPMGTFRTADGWVNIAAMSGFDRFCDALGAPELARDPRFAEAGARRAHRDELRQACEAVLATRSTAHWMERFVAAGLPAGPVHAMDAVFADPQVRELGMTREVRTGDGHVVRVLRTPVSFSDTPTSIRSAAPPPGADTRAVLAELGYGDAEVDALLAGGAAAEVSTGRPWESA